MSDIAISPESLPAILEALAPFFSNNVHTSAESYDIIGLGDVQALYEVMEKEKILSKYNFPSSANSDGRWHVYVKDDLARSGRRQIYGRSLDDLKNKVYQFEKGISGSARKTFRECFDLVQKEKLRYVKDPEKKLSVENTIRRNQTEYNRYFGGTAFEKKYIDSISDNDLDDLCVSTLNRLDLRSKAFQSMRSIMKGIFDLAYRKHWIDDNAYQRLDYHRYRDMLLKPVPVSERLHSDEDISRIIRYIHEHQKKYPRYIGSYALELQIITAMRRGELPPLRWADIHDEGGLRYLLIFREQITVKANGKGSPEHFELVEHTKTFRDRRFPLTSRAEECLERLRKVHDRFYPNSEFLFPADTPNGCITNNVVYNFYRRVCKHLGIKISRDVIKGTHSFRRNAISHVINTAEGDATMASQLYGNTPDVALRNYYAGLDLEAAKKVLEAGNNEHLF